MNLSSLIPTNLMRYSAAFLHSRITYLVGLVTCGPSFFIVIWDRRIEQCELTLNLLQLSRINPKSSVWAYISDILTLIKILYLLQEQTYFSILSQISVPVGSFISLRDDM